MNFAAVQKNFSQHGLVAGMHYVAKRAVNRVVPLRILRGVKLTLQSLNQEYLALPAGLTGRFMDERRLHALASQPAYDIDESLVDEALGKGDLCYAIFDGSELASYGWYSHLPTRIGSHLVFHFDSAYTYMYKGYTLPPYRGKRLHAVGMARALVASVEAGAKGILSYVDSTNFASLTSCHRMGYSDVGSIYVLGGGRWQRTWATGECSRYGICVEPEPSNDPGQSAQAA